MTMLYRRDPTEWVARETCGPGKQTSDLIIGQIIVWERRPYRVAEFTPRMLVDWKPEYIEAWTEAGRPDPEMWRQRPIVVMLTPEFEGGTEKHLEASANYSWPVLPQHFAVCRLCLELPPCRHEWEESVLRYARVEMDAVMRILPGACHECKEPIRPRQGTVRFEGPNLVRPDLGDDSAVFHTRRECWSGAKRYEDRWAADDPGRRRKLYCYGTQLRHLDGSWDCTLGDMCAGDVNHHDFRSHHPRGVNYVGSDCWCVTGEPRPASTLPVSDDKLF